MANEKEDLPFGWVVKQSKSYPDRIYYFNINTGASTWEFPDLLQHYGGQGDPCNMPVLAGSSLKSVDNFHSPDSSQNTSQQPYSVLAQASQGKPTTSGTVKDRTALNPNPKERYSGNKTTSQTQHVANKKVHNKTEYLNLKDKGRTLPIIFSHGQSNTNGNLSTVSCGKVERPNAPQFVDTGQKPQTRSSRIIHDQGRINKLNKPEMIGKAQYTKKTNSPSKPYPMSRNGTFSPKGKGKSLLPSQSGKPTGLMENTDVLSLIKHQLRNRVAKRVSENSKVPVSTTNGSFKSESHTKAISYLQSECANLCKGVNQSDGRNCVKQQISHSKCQVSGRSQMSSVIANKAAATASSGAVSSSQILQNVKILKEIRKHPKETDPSTELLGLINQQLQRGKRRASASENEKGKVDDAVAAYNKSVSPGIKTLSSVLSQGVKSKSGERNAGKLATANTTKGDSYSKSEIKRSRVDDKSVNLAKTSTYVGVGSKGGNRNNRDVSNNTVQKIDVPIADKRKVVRTSQYPVEERNVKLKDKKLTNLTASKQVGNQKDSQPKDVQVDMTVKANVIEISDDSVKSVDDISDRSDYNHNKSTEFKLFIGDKDKLMSIQSWINNLQEDAGSESPSTFDSQAMLTSRNDSGYVSPENNAVPKRKGWPGELKKSSTTSREVVVMEVDECLVPTESSTELDTEENMEYDEVLVEVRQQVSANNDKNTASFESALSEAMGVAPASKQEQYITVVVDTNVLMSDIALLEKLKDYQVPGDVLRPCLFIPWIVLRELDALKETVKPGKLSLSLATQKKARAGISFLKNSFGSKHPRVRGQTPKQAEEAAKDFQSHCNDDAVLQACLHCQKSVLSVVLLSNDNNLITKALVTGVPAYTAKEIIPGLQKAQETVLGQSKCLTPARTPSVEYASSASHTPRMAPFGTPVGATCSNTSTLCHTPANAPFGTPVGASCSNTNSLCHTPANSNIQSASPSCFQMPFSAQTPASPGCSAPNSANLQTPASGQPRTPLSAYVKVNGSDKQNVTSQMCNASGSKGRFSDSSKDMFTQGVTLSYKPKQTCLADKILKEEKPCTSEDLMEDIFSRMKSMLHEAFGKILEVEMQKAYDDIWKDILYKKPPWTLIDILECWKKHWMAVFGMVFSRQLNKNIQVLLDNLSRPPSKCKTVEVVSDVCANSVDILREAKQRNLYGPRVLEVCDTVTVLTELCYGLKLGSIDIASISGLDKYMQSKIKPDVIQTTQSTPDLQNGSNSNCVSSNSMDTGQQSVSQTVSHSTLQNGSQHISQTDPQTISQTGPQSVLQTCSQTVFQTGPQTISQNGSQSVSQIPSLEYNSSLSPSASQTCPTGNIPQTGSGAGNQNQEAEQSELLAGERFSQIWKFIYKHCNEFYKMLSDTAVIDSSNFEPILKELVSSSLELRKFYAGLLDLNVEDLKDHEAEFNVLCNISNSFLANFNEQDGLPSTTPLQLLILYSKPEYRATLQQFLSQLDEMLQVMYQCLHKLCPDD